MIHLILPAHHYPVIYFYQERTGGHLGNHNMIYPRGTKIIWSHFIQWPPSCTQWVHGSLGNHHMIKVVTFADVEDYLVPLEMKGYICHFIKWRIYPFISKETTWWLCTPLPWHNTNIFTKKVELFLLGEHRPGHYIYNTDIYKMKPPYW